MITIPEELYKEIVAFEKDRFRNWVQDIARYHRLLSTSPHTLILKDFSPNEVLSSFRAYSIEREDSNFKEKLESMVFECFLNWDQEAQPVHEFMVYTKLLSNWSMTKWETGEGKDVFTVHILLDKIFRDGGNYFGEIDLADIIESILTLSFIKDDIVESRLKELCVDNLGNNIVSPMAFRLLSRLFPELAFQQVLIIIFNSLKSDQPFPVRQILFNLFKEVKFDDMIPETLDHCFDNIHIYDSDVQSKIRKKLYEFCLKNKEDENYKYYCNAILLRYYLSESIDFTGDAVRMFCKSTNARAFLKLLPSILDQVISPGMKNLQEDFFSELSNLIIELDSEYHDLFAYFESADFIIKKINNPGNGNVDDDLTDDIDKDLTKFLKFKFFWRSFKYEIICDITRLTVGATV